MTKTKKNILEKINKDKKDVFYDDFNLKEKNIISILITEREIYLDKNKDNLIIIKKRKRKPKWISFLTINLL